MGSDQSWHCWLISAHTSVPRQRDAWERSSFTTTLSGVKHTATLLNDFIWLKGKWTSYHNCTYIRLSLNFLLAGDSTHTSTSFLDLAGLRTWSAEGMCWLPGGHWGSRPDLPEDWQAVNTRLRQALSFWWIHLTWCQNSSTVQALMRRSRPFQPCKSPHSTWSLYPLPLSILFVSRFCLALSRLRWEEQNRALRGL